MNWHRLGKLALVGVGTFTVIAAAAWLFIGLLVPVTPARMVAFLSAMFAVTGGIIAAVVWVSRTPST